MKLIEKPNLPQTFGTGVSAQYVLHHENRFYLLPGVTKKLSSNELECIPIENIPHSMRDKLSKPPFSLLTWYDLNLQEKRQAILLLLNQFEHDINKVAEILGHKVEYVHELQQIQPASEQRLTHDTKMDDRIIFDNQVQSLADYYIFPKKHNSLFLNKFHNILTKNKELLTPQHPFIKQTIQQLDTTALHFLFSLRTNLFTIKERADMLFKLEKKGETWNSILFELCDSLQPSLHELSLDEVIQLLFPKTQLTQLTPEQIKNRVNEGLRAYFSKKNQYVPTLKWDPAFSRMPFYGIALLGNKNLLIDYIANNMSATIAGMNVTEKEKFRQDISRWINQLQLQSIETEESLVSQMIRSAIKPSRIPSKLSPNCFVKLLGTYENRIVSIFEELIDDKTISIQNDLTADHISTNIVSKLFSYLSQDAQCQIKYSACLKQFKIDAPGLSDKDFYIQLHEMLNLLTQLEMPEEIVYLVKHSPFFQWAQFVATRLQKPGNHNTLLSVECEMQNVLIQKSAQWLATFDDMPFIKNILQEMNALVTARNKAPAAKIKGPEVKGIPHSLDDPNYERWAESMYHSFIRDVEDPNFLHAINIKDATVKDNLNIISAFLKQIRYDFHTIKNEYIRHTPSLLLGEDYVYAKKGFLCHFNNAVVKDYKTNQLTADPKILENNLKNIEWRILSLYVIARAWHTEKNDYNKINMLFTSFSGYCIESRTRSLFDNPPSWSNYHAGKATPNREELNQKIKQTVDRINNYVQQYQLDNQHHDQILKENAIQWIKLWVEGDPYTDHEGEQVVTQDLISEVIENLGLAEGAAEQSFARLLDKFRLRPQENKAAHHDFYARYK